MNENHDFMTVTEVSEYLNLSTSAVYVLTRRKDFPVCRFGGSIRVPREPLHEWVRQMTYLPNERKGA